MIPKWLSASLVAVTIGLVTAACSGSDRSGGGTALPTTSPPSAFAIDGAPEETQRFLEAARTYLDEVANAPRRAQEHPERFAGLAETRMAVVVDTWRAASEFASEGEQQMINGFIGAQRDQVALYRQCVDVFPRFGAPLDACLAGGYDTGLGSRIDKSRGEFTAWIDSLNG